MAVVIIFEPSPRFFLNETGLRQAGSLTSNGQSDRVDMKAGKAFLGGDHNCLVLGRR